MKKLLLIVVLLVSTLSFAQGYQKGVNNLNIGIGLGLANTVGDMVVPPISVGYQVGFHEKFSLGGIVGFSSSSESWGGSWFGSREEWEWNYTYIILGARGEYHFMEPKDEWDLYGGATLGYQIVSVSEPDEWDGFGYEASGSEVLFGFHLGARYPISPSWGLFGEVGYGIGYITIGANFKL